MLKIAFSGDAATVRSEMLHFLGLPASVSPAVIVSETVAATTAIEGVLTTAVEEKPKTRRGRPKKAETEVAETEVAETEVVETVDNSVEYEDVEVKRTASDLREACIAAVDRVGVDSVRKLLLDKYKAAMAHEVPADKINEAYDLVAALVTDGATF